MKRIVLFCSLAILMFVSVLYAHAETFEIPLDDSYVEGVIVPLATEKMSAEENEVQVYSFHLEEPGNIDLHFISHVNNMRFQYMFQISSDMTLNYLIRDADENVIGRGTSYADGNSKQEFALTSGVFDIVCSTSEAGNYQIHVEPKEIEGRDLGDEASPQEDTGRDSERDDEKSIIIEKIGSVITNDVFPSTVGGQIVIGIFVAVIGGLILFLDNEIEGLKYRMREKMSVYKKILFFFCKK